MATFKQNTLTLILLGMLFFRTHGQTPKKIDFYYEKIEQNDLVRVVKITDGQHTFYSKDKRIITTGTFKNGRLLNGEQYYYNDRILYYKNGKYDSHILVEEISDEDPDSLKIKNEKRTP